MYVYGMVTLNNGDKFRARKDEDGKVTYMSHHGQKNASAKISKSFAEGKDVAVQGSNSYRFPDEQQNQNMDHASSKSTQWKIH